MKSAEYWINKLNLTAHPEGGFFKEVYRSDEVVSHGSLPARFNGDRNYCTSIYFLLKGNQVSHFHRIKSDETWHYYQGSAVEIFILDKDGNLSVEKLGANIEEGESFQVTVPKQCWFGATVTDKESFALVGCTVSPGFHFEDFEMAKREDLSNTFPEHTDIINRLTMD